MSLLPRRTHKGMPLYRHLRPSIPQFLLDSSQRPHATPVIYHTQTASSPCTRHHGRHGYSYTRKHLFSTTSHQFLASAREPTYYEILDVPVTATPSEIKKCASPKTHTPRILNLWTKQKVLLPLPSPPPRSQPGRSNSFLPLCQNFLRLQCS
jgi:hypothetical protein